MKTHFNEGVKIRHNSQLFIVLQLLRTFYPKLNLVIKVYVTIYNPGSTSSTWRCRYIYTSPRLGGRCLIETKGEVEKEGTVTLEWMKVFVLQNETGDHNSEYYTKDTNKPSITTSLFRFYFPVYFSLCK